MDATWEKTGQRNQNITFTRLSYELPPTTFNPADTSVKTDVARFLWFAAPTGAKTSKAYFYRSNPLEYIATQNAGLYGMIAVEKAGAHFDLDSRGMPLKPKGVDRELVIVVHVQLEDGSFCGELNCYTVSPFR